MKPVHLVLTAAGLLLLGVIIWWLLTLPGPQADWLTVEAPARVVPGATITLRVTVSAPDPKLQLTADLHGWTRRNHSLRDVSHAQPQRLGPAVQPVEFSLPVPTLPDLAVVRAIIYLSPSGQWSDQVRVARSAEIPVMTAGLSPLGLEPVRMHDLAPDPVIPRRESVFLRRVLVGLWLGLAVTLGLQTRRPRRPFAATPGPKIAPGTTGLIVACLALMLVELLGLEQNVGDFARQFALRHDLYEKRHLVQQIAVLFSVVGMAAAIVALIIWARRRRLVCSLVAYAVISLIALLSLHETDALIYATVLGLPVEQWAKLATLGLALSGLRSPPGPP